MRIVGGMAGGLGISGPGKMKIRPTSEKVREALFNMIDVEGRVFLDLFAGTGAVGCEALSRGASYITLVESHKPSADLARKNTGRIISKLNGESGVKIVKMDAVRFLENFSGKPQQGYDFIFCDPPYDWEENLPALVDLVMAGEGKGALTHGGTLILETRSGMKTELPYKYTKLKKYGDTTLIYYARN